MKRRRYTTKEVLRKRRAPIPPKRSKPIGPRTAKQYFSLSETSQDKWTRATHVITQMRAEGVSLKKASREHGMDPRTVIRLGRSALRKGSDGQYKAKPSDRLLRVLVIPTPDGPREVATRDSRQATMIAEYSNAVRRYLATGDLSALRKIRRKTVIDASGKRVRLLADLAELERLGSAGVFAFESLYAKAG